MSKGIERSRCIGYHSSWFFEGANSFDTHGHQFDRVFEDKLTAENSSRLAFQELLAYLEVGDLLVVQSIGRLANSASGVQSIVKGLAARKCSIIFRDEDLFLSMDNGKDSQMFHRLINAMVKVELLSQMTSQNPTESATVDVQSEPIATETNVVNIEEILRQKRASGISVDELQEEYNLTRGAIFRMTA